MKAHISFSGVGQYRGGGSKDGRWVSCSKLVKRQRRAWLTPKVSTLKRISILFVVTFATGCSSISTLISPPTAIVTNSSSLELVSGAEDFIHVISMGGKFCKVSPSGEMVSSSDSLSGKGDTLSSGVTVSSQNLGTSAYLVSEIMYRVCELSNNYGLSKDEATSIFIKGLEAVSDISGNPAEISNEVTAANP